MRLSAFACEPERPNVNVFVQTLPQKWTNLRAALAFHFAYYYFCRMRSSIRCTPAMAAGITKSVWTQKDY